MSKNITPPSSLEEKAQRFEQLIEWLEEHKTRNRGFDMNNWAGRAECGTTVCMAGLVAFKITTEGTDKEWDNSSSKVPFGLVGSVPPLQTSTGLYLQQHGITSTKTVPVEWCRVRSAHHTAIAAAASVYLGLTDFEFNCLFFHPQWDLVERTRYQRAADVGDYYAAIDAAICRVRRALKDGLDEVPADYFKIQAKEHIEKENAQ